jgi:hypothetical protein
MVLEGGSIHVDGEGHFFLFRSCGQRVEFVVFAALANKWWSGHIYLDRYVHHDGGVLAAPEPEPQHEQAGDRERAQGLPRSHEGDLDPSRTLR